MCCLSDRWHIHCHLSLRILNKNFTLGALHKDNIANDSSNKDDRPFPVGYAAFPTTFLPARDGVGFPHSSFISGKIFSPL